MPRVPSSGPGSASRGAALLLGALLVVSLSLPSLIVGHFLVKRSSIEREVCVMRDAAPEQNTCHGNCYLMRQMEVARHKADAPFTQFNFRPQPSDRHELAIWPPVLPLEQRFFPLHCDALHPGVLSQAEPVPWA